MQLGRPPCLWFAGGPPIMVESRRTTGFGTASARGLAVMTSTNRRRRGLILRAVFLAFSLLCLPGGLVAQEVITVTSPDGQAVQLSPEQAKAMNAGQPGLPPGAQPAGPPAPQASPAGSKTGRRRPEERGRRRRGEERRLDRQAAGETAPRSRPARVRCQARRQRPRAAVQLHRAALAGCAAVAGEHFQVQSRLAGAAERLSQPHHATTVFAG